MNISILGHATLVTILILSIFSIFHTKFLRQISATILATSIFSMAILIYAYAISDFSILNVYENSELAKPLIFKISASWGNHEGSMLLFLMFLCIAYGVYARCSEDIVSCKILNIVISLITIFVLFFSNPFLASPELYADGLGLNPLLQDIGLIIHPPMLYIGLVLLAIPFSIVLSMLIQASIKEAKALYIYSMLSFIFITMGIILGGWWAYRELGWGGFWFWDPVENASLLSWLSSLILSHFAFLLYKRKIFLSLLIFSGIGGFLLSLLSTFLVRSGLMLSVHSFALDTERGITILMILTFLILLSCTIFVKQYFGLLSAIRDEYKIDHTNMARHNKLSFYSFYGGMLIIIAMIISILLGLVYPIIFEKLFDVSITIGQDYYNFIFGVLILCILGVFFIPATLYNQVSIREWFAYAIIFGILIALVVVQFFAISSYNMLGYIVLTLLLANICIIFKHILFNTLKKNIQIDNLLTNKIPHLIFIILIFTMVHDSVFSLNESRNISIANVTNKENKILVLDRFYIRMDNISIYEEDNFIGRTTSFEIYDKNRFSLGNITTENRFYPTRQISTIEAGTLSTGLLSEIYIAIGKYDSEYANVRIQYHPSVKGIWLSSILLILFMCVSVIIRVREKNI